MFRRIFPAAWACGLVVAHAAAPNLTPPPDPVVPAGAHAAAPHSSGQPAPASPTAKAGSPTGPSAPATPPPFHYSEADIPDSIGAVTVRPVPEASEDLPAFVQQANYLIAHHDSVTAADYLQKVALSPAVSVRDHARVILQLADCLEAAQRPAEELCWLKIWMQLYADRSEVGAVAYRMGLLYTQMGLSALARDAYYLALSNAVNHGQVDDPDDLAQYTKLTTGTLWALAQNEYQSGNWQRAAELFDRYRHEAPSADAPSLARAGFLQADCYYQLRQTGEAAAAYQLALKEHPFHPLAPAARLRMYHLDVLAGHPEQAQAELEALVWTVRTVWPQDEALWQKRTAELLLALNREDGTVLPPLLARSLQLAAQDKAWQAELGHYDRLANLEATIPQAGLAPRNPSSTSGGRTGLHEQDDLAAMQQSIDALAPPPISEPNRGPHP